MIKNLDKNIFCKVSDLNNEATVEHFFVNRLFQVLGYADVHIKPKTSLKKLVVSHKVEMGSFRPDYAIDIGGKIRWILEAKGTNESLDDHIVQCSSYCLSLNRASKQGNPTEYFILTNGLELRLYRWDDASPLLSLKFNDFNQNNVGYMKLINIISYEVLSAKGAGVKPASGFDLKKEPLSLINTYFAWCHQYIHKKDSLNQSAAFLEFVKLIFLKLLSDKKFYELKALNPSLAINPAEIPFSVAWIESREVDHLNPISDVQFKKLIDDLERGIIEKTRKRIFDPNDRIRLSAETIKGVVKKLQYVDLVSLDADLSGRLFETFLNATMRGKDLGQFFTPRSVVKLAVALANPYADGLRQEKIMDACCGSGGFLIEALAHLWHKVDRNISYSSNEKQELKKKIAGTCIYGDDISRDPPLARIARMNMFLHGDGGSRIFEVDILDKSIALVPEVDSLEIQQSKDELRGLFKDNPDGFIDVILTNPPFAKEYHAKDPRDKEILKSYNLSYEGSGEAKKLKSTVRSSVLFLERYHDILKPGGRLIAVIDESILGSKKYREVREWIKDKFLIKAVVSLPGDAFQRSLARVKTSLIYLVKKKNENDQQGKVFMSWTTAVGVDDPSRIRVLPIDARMRETAKAEIDRIVHEFSSFMNGSLLQSTEYAKIVDAEYLSDRLDVKYCAIKTARQKDIWEGSGLTIGSVTDFVDVVFPAEDEELNDE